MERPAKQPVSVRHGARFRGGASRTIRRVSVLAVIAVVVPLAALAAPAASAATATRPGPAPVKALAADEGPGGSSTTLPSGVRAHHGPGGEIDVNVCPDPEPGHATCLSRLRIDAAARASRPVGLGGRMTPNTLGDGGAYSPAYLQSAYNAPSATAGSGQTVAIVDAYDDPNAEADLATYRSHYGLPDCTIANGCFTKVDQYGGTNYPAPDGGWAVEISLDLDMVSALCPKRGYPFWSSTPRCWGQGRPPLMAR